MKLLAEYFLGPGQSLLLLKSKFQVTRKYANSYANFMQIIFEYLFAFNSNVNSHELL